MQIDKKKVIESLKNSTAAITMFADGFVDEVWEIVNERTSLKEFSVYSRMNRFADRITSSGSGGVGLELVKKRRAFGGFTANIGFAAARLGVDTAMVGVYGEDALDPIFDEVAEICGVYSLAAPAITHVFEFDDGKILMSHMEAVQDISWQSIVDKLGMEKLTELLAKSDMLGVGYWSLLPAFDEIVMQVFTNLPQDGKQRRFFFDFADFRKKDEASLDYSMKLLKRLNEKIPMMLSVNEHEAAVLFELHGRTLDGDAGSLPEKTEYVRKQMGLDEFVVHTPHYAVAACSAEAPAYAPSVFVEKPVRSAGAGDTFNGGYAAAKLAGLDISERLFAANANVRFFLKNGFAPDLDEMLGEM
jgi:sugar/nucleoside kinase (ribokinase family)